MRKQKEIYHANENNMKNLLLKGIQTLAFLRDSPDIVNATNLLTAETQEKNETTKHYYGLNHVCPDDRADSALFVQINTV